MKLAVATLLALALWPAVAQAHRIPEADAESRWYYVFNTVRDECNVGGDCSLRKASLDCDSIYGRPHAWSCDWEYRQERYSFPFAKDYRWCHIYGVLVHTTVDEWHKSCTGWS